MTPEKGPLTPSTSPERGAVTVQPNKEQDLAMLVAEINAIPGETLGEDRSGDMGGSQSGMVKTGGATHGTSARDQALANLPVPSAMQKQLEAHIRTEVKKLRKQTKLIIRSKKPGSAYALAQLYAKIRHLNALLGQLLDVSYDVLKRLFVKVFIDKQPI